MLLKRKLHLTRWNLKKADWLSFQTQCSSELTDEAVMSTEDPAGQFTDLLIQAANKAIPKTRFSKKLPKVPWFNDSCKRAIKERKKAKRKFFSNPTLSNVQNFKESIQLCVNSVQKWVSENGFKFSTFRPSVLIFINSTFFFFSRP